MSSIGGPPPLPKLPVWDVVGLAYSNYFRNFVDVLRASWLWVMLTAVLVGIMSWQQWSLMGAVIANSINHGPFPPAFDLSSFGTLSFIIVGANLVLILATVSIAVAWHRRVILGEQPAFGGLNFASRSFWRYIGIGLAIGGLAFLPMFSVLVPVFIILANAAKGYKGVLAGVVFLLAIAAYVAAIAIVLRLSMLLPARAAGVDLSFAQSWSRTRGNCWRIFWGGAICTLAPMMVAEIALLPFGFPDPKTMIAAGPNAIPAFFASGDFALGMTAISTVFTAYYLLTLPIGIGFLSYSYRHFFREAISPAL